jgi:predicted enzyme related to lactoylglutathione lyase
MGKPVVHFEFWSPDPARVSTFYETVFDWAVRPMPEADYHLVETGGEGGINGGIMTPRKGPWPAKMTFYIDVDDLDAYRERIEAAGGTILVARQDVGGIGSFALFEDPDGRVIGLWQQAGH